jgi:hypothetical protein
VGGESAGVRRACRNLLLPPSGDHGEERERGSLAAGRSFLTSCVVCTAKQTGIQQTEEATRTRPRKIVGRRLLICLLRGP